MNTITAGLCFTLALSGASLVQAQIKYVAAFGTLKLASPLAFQGIPGKTDMFMATEGYAGNVVVIHKVGGNWTKTTVHHQEVSTTGSNEQGMLGLCFHPNFKTNRKYYINYNPKGNLSTQIEERELDETLLKDAGKSRKIFSIPQPKANHKGGTIAFGPKDGYLYVGMGDGQNSAWAQDKSSIFGKMLRVDVDKPAGGKEYGIPSDNPFANGGGAPEIWAWGFRNPWKWAFDPLNGDLWLGDVGNNREEEVDIVVKGANYGWPAAEGSIGNTGDNIAPVMSLSRTEGRAIVGGTVYRGNPSSPYYGAAFVSDNLTRNVWSLKKTGGNQVSKKSEAGAPTGPSSFGTDDQGLMYLVGWGNGTIYRLESPDLGPVTVWADKPGRLRERAKATFQAARGARLERSAFGGSASLEVRGLKGERISGIRPDEAVSLQAGIYLLTAPEDRDRHSVLVVR